MIHHDTPTPEPNALPAEFEKQSGPVGVFDTKGKKKRREKGEEMVTIDAATRQKEREREKARHDKTFDNSILDVGIDSIPAGTPKARSEVSPAVTPMPNSSQDARPIETPAPSPPPQGDIGAETSVALEVVPIISSSKSSPTPSPTPSATASPHN